MSASATSRGRPAVALDHLLGALLGALYVTVLLYTAPDIGLSRDEGIYVIAAESYAHWFELLASDPGQALQQPAIDRFFQFNHEHPPLMKTLFALSYLANRNSLSSTTNRWRFAFPAWSPQVFCSG